MGFAFVETSLTKPALARDFPLLAWSAGADRVHAVLEPMLTGDMARSDVPVTKNLEKVDEVRFRLGTELEIAYLSVRLDRRSRLSGRFNVSGWRITHTYENQGRKGLMKRSIYAKTSKPYLPAQRTNLSGVSFNDSFSKKRSRHR